MNLNLLQLIGKYLSVAVITVASYFNVGNYNEENIENKNQFLNQNSKVVNSVNYNTVIEYDKRLPSNITNVVKEGIVGLSYEENNEIKIIQEAQDQIVKQGTGAYGIYKGKLVGYGPDCKGCSGEGYLACRRKDGKRFSLKYDGINYDDEEYGKVRILAANISQFPCGTIIKIEKKDGTNFLAIVLDKVSTQINNGILMDLAYSSQTDKTVFAVDGLTGNDITFNVQRWGW